MRIVNEIDDQQCSAILNDVNRLRFINDAKLMGSGSDEALDRLTYLASILLDVPLTIVSFVGKETQYFKSFHGLPEPWASEREIPIDVSVCQYTLVGDVLSLKDVREHPLLADNPAVPALNLVGYLGVPLLTEEGHNLGAFCAISDEAREWSKKDFEILKTLTKSIMAEIELKIKIEQLDREKKEWEQTVSMLLHDLRNPLGTILGWSDLGKNDENPLIKAEAFSSISRCADQGIKIVDNILNWKLSQLNHDGELEKNFFEINNLLIPYLEDMQKTQEVTIEHNLGGKTIELFGHKDSILRAIINLVSNSIKYGDTSKPIRITIKNENNNSCIYVHNFGDPIDKTAMSEIFKFSKRALTQDCLDKEGWGIGLYLVDSVARAHGGKVSVKSDLVDGTEFKLMIPNKYLM